MEIDKYLFEEEAFRGERTSLKFRWILIALVAIFILATFLRGEKQEAFWSFIPAGIFLFYNILLGTLIKRGENLYFLRYFSVSIDIIVLTFHIHINSRFFSPIAVSTTASIFIYPILMFLTVLRYDKKLIVYATLLALLMLNLNYILQFKTIERSLIEKVISSDPMGQVYKSGYLLILGIFFLKIPDMVKRYIEKQKTILEEKNEYILNLLLEKREKKALKSNLSELNTLHNELKQKTEKIEEQNIRLTDLVQTKDRLISFISHDLKNSFSTMSSIIETTKKNLSQMEGEELGVAMEILFKHSLNNQLLFENLLQWAKLQRGQIMVNKEKINLFAFCAKTSNHFESDLKAKELKLELDVSKELVVLADPILLTSICNNLIGNAIKFSHRGGKIQIGTEIKNHIISISINDVGTGIKQEKLDHIFSIEKGNSTMGTEGEKGSGFGLILCKELMERMGGTIDIHSKEGEGTSVIISLIKIN